MSVYHRDAIDPEGLDSLGRVLRMVPAHTRVLDLGCSTGALGVALAEKGCDVTGVEGDPADLAVAGGRLPRALWADLDSVVLADLLPGESFDIVILADVLEHLKKPERLLSMVRDILAPSGSVIFSIPNVAHASVRLAVWQGEFPYSESGILDRTHLRMFTLRSVQALFAEAEYEISALERTILPVSQGVAHSPWRTAPWRRSAMTRTPEALTLQFVGRAEPRGPRAPLPRRPARIAASPERALIEEQTRLIAAQARMLDEYHVQDRIRAASRQQAMWRLLRGARTITRRLLLLLRA